jgi:hypothetical protein
MSRIWPCLVLAASCSKPPPPKPPPTERSADKVADVAGRWVTSDDMDWGYSMTIEPSGVIDVWIDRGKAGRCEQKGTIEPARASRTFRVIYSRGECNPEAVNLPLELTVKSFTGDALTIVVAGQARTYLRAPDSAAGGEQAPAQLVQ